MDANVRLILRAEGVAAALAGVALKLPSGFQDTHLGRIGRRRG